MQAELADNFFAYLIRLADIGMRQEADKIPIVILYRFYRPAFFDLQIFKKFVFEELQIFHLFSVAQYFVLMKSVAGSCVFKIAVILFLHAYQAEKDQNNQGIRGSR